MLSIRIFGLNTDFIRLTIVSSIHNYTCNKRVDVIFQRVRTKVFFTYWALMEAPYDVVRNAVIIRILTKPIFPVLRYDLVVHKTKLNIIIFTLVMIMIQFTYAFVSICVWFVFKECLHTSVQKETTILARCVHQE